MAHKQPMTKAGKAAMVCLGIAVVVLIAHLVLFVTVDHFTPSMWWLAALIYGAVLVSTLSGLWSMLLSRQTPYQDTFSPAMTGIMMNVVFVVLFFVQGPIGLGDPVDPEADALMMDRIAGVWSAEQENPTGLQTARLRLKRDRTFLFKARDEDRTLVGDMDGWWEVRGKRLELTVSSSRVGDPENLGNPIVWSVRAIDDDTINVNGTRFDRIDIATTPEPNPATTTQPSETVTTQPADGSMTSEPAEPVIGQTD